MELCTDTLQIMCDRAEPPLQDFHAAEISAERETGNLRSVPVCGVKGKMFKPEENVYFTTQHGITAAWDTV